MPGNSVARSPTAAAAIRCPATVRTDGGGNSPALSRRRTLTIVTTMSVGEGPVPPRTRSLLPAACRSRIPLCTVSTLSGASHLCDRYAWRAASQTATTGKAERRRHHRLEALLVRGPSGAGRPRDRVERGDGREAERARGESAEDVRVTEVRVQHVRLRFGPGARGREPGRSGRAGSKCRCRRARSLSPRMQPRDRRSHAGSSP